MTFNFVLNNALTYRRPAADAALARWLARLAQVRAHLLGRRCSPTSASRRCWCASACTGYSAALAGIVIGSVWNYALSSRFVWGQVS